MTLQHAIPMPGMLHPAGPAASPLASLGWVLLAISVVVVLVVSALVLTAVLRAGRESTGVRRSGRGLSWIVVGGLVVPTVILTIVFVLTVRTLGAASPPARSAATIQVVGHRWWWEVRLRPCWAWRYLPSSFSAPAALSARTDRSFPARDRRRSEISRMEPACRKRVGSGVGGKARRAKEEVRNERRGPPTGWLQMIWLPSRNPDD